MTNVMKFPRALVLCPNSRGIAFAYFTAAHSLTDWGVKDIRGTSKHADSMRAVKQLIERFQPTMIVTEDTHERGSRRHPRMQKLGAAIVEYCKRQDIDVVSYSRTAIQAAFSVANASTKDEINTAVAALIPALLIRQPNKRKPWESESHAQGIFDAAALGLTYFADIGLLDIAQAVRDDDAPPTSLHSVRSPYLVQPPLPTLTMCV